MTTYIDGALSNPPLPPDYKVRFIPVAMSAQLVNLYHLARTALSGQDDSPYQRMIWASQEFHRQHPKVSENGAYKDLCGLLDR